MKQVSLFIAILMFFALQNQAQTISVPSVTQIIFCPGSSQSISFTTTGSFDAGSTFTAQLSNATGSFTNPEEIGSFIETSSSSGSRTMTVNIPTTSPSGTAYAMRVVNGTTIGSIVPSLTINPNTIIGTQPFSPVTTCSGAGTQAMSVIATGTGALTYQWYKNNIALSSTVAGFNKANISFTNPTASQAGTYKVVVAGGCGPQVTSNEVRLEVNPNTAITSQPLAPAASCTGLGGQTISVTATGTGTLSYQWKKNNVNLTDNGVVAGATTSSISLHNPTSGDAGSYTVVVSGGTCGITQTSTAVPVTVKAYPVISSTPTTPVSNCSGFGNQSLSVVATGTSLTYLWKKDGTALTSVAPYNATYDDPTLVITNATVEAAGAYIVEVTSNGCSVSTTPVTVSVKPAPTVSLTSSSTTPASLCVPSGIGSTLSVVYTATPTNAGTSPKYAWYNNGAIVSGITASTYTLASAYSSTIGIYCVVTTTQTATCPTVATATSTTISSLANNSTADSWQKKSNIAGAAKTFGTTFSIGNKGYLALPLEAGITSKTLWEYDPILNVWTQKANFPGTAREGVVSFSIGNYGYVGGGTNNNEVANNIYYADYYKYYPPTNSWSQVADQPIYSATPSPAPYGFTPCGGTVANPNLSLTCATPVYGAVGFSIGHKGYVVGGDAGYYTAGTPRKETWIFDPTDGQYGKWTRGNDYGLLNTSGTTLSGNNNYYSIGMCAFVIGDNAYVGQGTSNGSPEVKDYWYKYNATSEIWSVMPSSGSTGQAGIGIGWKSAFSIGGYGYISGGYNNRNDLAAATMYKDFRKYDPVGRTWTKITNEAPGNTYLGGFTLGGKGYALNSASSQDIYEYTPTGLSITTGSISTSDLCFGSTINVPYTIGCNNGFGTGGNAFKVELSDEMGTFSNPVVIGSVYASGSGTIPATIPTDIPAGNEYRIRVVATNPATIGYMSEQIFSILHAIPSAGAIAGAHAVPFPSHKTAEKLTNVTSAVSTPYISFTNKYTWERKDDITNLWEVVPGNVETDFLDYSTTDITYTYRRGANFSCSATSYTDPVIIKVFTKDNIIANMPSLDGKISGRVVSGVNGTVGVKNVNVYIQKQVSLNGSPATYIYSTTTNGTGDYKIENLFYGDGNNGDPSDVKFTITVSKGNDVIQLNHLWVIDNPSLANMEATLSVGEKTVIIPDFEDLSTIPITGNITQKCVDCLNSNDLAGTVIDELKDIPVKLLTPSNTILLIDTSGSGTHTRGQYGLTATEAGYYKIQPSKFGHKFTPKETTINTNTAGVTTGVNFVDDTTHTVMGVFRAGGKELIGSVVLEFTDYQKGRPDNEYKFRKQVTTGDSGRYSITLPPRKYKVSVVDYIPPFTAQTKYEIGQKFTTKGSTDATGKMYKVTQAGSSGAVEPTGATNQVITATGVVSTTESPAKFTYVSAAPNTNTRTTQATFTQDPITQDSIKRFFNTITKFLDAPYKCKDNSDSVRIVDIDSTNDTLNLIYHRPVNMVITGLDVECPNQYIVFNTYQKRKFVVKLYEGNPSHDVKIATIATDTFRMITNVHITDLQGDEDTLYSNPVNGIDSLFLVGGVPNLIESEGYLKNLRFLYFDKFGRKVDSTKQHVFVEGYYQPTGTFTTVSPDLPIVILHAPPGDQSVSTWESGTSVELVENWSRSDGVEAGLEFKKGWGDENKPATFYGSLTLGVNTNSTWTKSGSKVTSSTTSVSYSTEPGGGDVFIGAARNLKYGVAEIRELKGCQIQERKDIIVEPNGYATTFTYSEGQIKDVIIPILKEIADNATDPTIKRRYNDYAKVWQQTLDNNDRTKASARFVKNRSFDGNAGPITETTSSSSSQSTSTSFDLEINASVAILLGINPPIIGESEWTPHAAYTYTNGSSSERTTTNETIISYTLDDDDAGDYFSVDIKKDRVYNTPVFVMVAGTASCPPEDFAQQRDKGGLNVPVQINGLDNKVQYNLATNGEGIFKLKLQNFSESRETRTYNLKFDNGTNPEGAIITIGGLPALGSIPYTIPYLGSVTVTVSVKKNPYVNVYSYEGLRFVMTDNCGGDGADMSENTISAFFASSCSDIRMAQPTSNWVASKASNNLLPIKFNSYNKNNLSSVSLEYAHTGGGDWETGTLLDQNGSTVTAIGQAQITNPNETNVNWNLQHVADGNYEVRLKLICPSGTVYTDRVAGIIDRTAPTLFGNAQPSDHSFVRGDEISFTYNELLKTSAIGTNNIKLIKRARINTPAVEIPILVSAYQDKINIVPQVDILTTYLDSTLQVIATDISDVYGNINTPHTDTFGFKVEFMTAGTGIKIKLSNVDETKTSIMENSGDSLRIKFKFTEPANTTSNIPVHFVISGSSAYTTDTSTTDYVVSYSAGQNLTTTFTGSEGTINIPAHQDNAIINIKPVNDALWEEDETITITLLAGGDYEVNETNSSITDIIKNDDYPAPIITASGALCQGGSITLTTPSVIEGNAITAYQWKRGTAVIGTTQTISVTASGTYTVKVTTANGFSGLSNPYVITSSASPVSTTLHSICAVELPYQWNGISCEASGTYTAHLTNSAGCDSTAQLVLTVNQPSSSIETIFSTGNYIWHDVTYTASNNTATWNEVNAAGCDSIVTLHLTIANTCTPTQATFNVEACNGYTWHGIRFNSSVSGVYWIGVNAVGCDSTEYLNLTIKHSATSIRTVYVCGNQFPYVWNGHNYQVAGTYTTLLSTISGCDSLAKLVLIQKNTSTSTTNVAVCIRKMPFTWNGTSYATAGTYTKLLTNAAGCDSLATLVLTIAPLITSTNEIAVCSNQLPFVWNGESYTEAGSYSANLISSGGCDSVAYLVFTINQAPAIPSISAVGSSRVCSGQSVTLELVNSTGLMANETNQWSNSQTTPYISVGTAGNYAVTVSNSLGCSATSDSVAVTIDPLPSPTITGAASFCAGSTTSLNAGAVYDSYLWSNGETTPSIAVSTQETFSLTVTNSFGCNGSSSVTTSMFNNPINIPIIVASGSTTFCNGEHVDLTVDAQNQSNSSATGLSYLWSNGASTSSVTATTSGDYTVRVSNADGCFANSMPTTVSVNTVPVPVLLHRGTTTFCSTDSVTFTLGNVIGTNTNPTIPLDEVSGAILAVGLRKLNSAYAGSALRLRRSSDNEEQDFGFVGANLDTAAIATWLAGASGYCTTLYDQAEKDGNITQPDAAAQPLYVYNGVNNKPSLHFTTTQYMNNEVNYPAPYSLIYGAKVSGTSERVLSAKNNNWLLGYWGSKMDVAYFEGMISPTDAPLANNEYNIYAAKSNGTSSTVYKNGADLYNNENGVAGPNGIELNGYQGLFEFSDCDFTDLMVFGSELENSDMNTLNNSISNYYKLGGISYLWSSGQTTDSIIVKTAGNYSVTVTNSYGCSATSAVTPVTVYECNVSGVLSGNAEICAGSPTPLSLEVGGTGPWSGELSDGTLFTGSVSPITISVSPTENTIYTIHSLRDLHSWATPNVMSGIANVTVNPVPVAPVVDVTQPKCDVATGTITITTPVITPVGELTYSIDGTNYSSSVLYTNLNAGTYLVTAKIGVGCASPATSVVVNVQPVPSAPLATLIQPSCNVATGTITITALPGLEYRFNGAVYGSDLSFPNLNAGSYTIQAINTASTCESAITTVWLNEQPATPAVPTVTNIVQPTCTVATGTVRVTAISGLTFSIDGDNYSNSTGIFTEVSTGTYSVTAKYAGGTCVSAATSVTIDVQPVSPAAPTGINIVQPTCTVATGNISVTAIQGLEYSIAGTNYNSTGIFPSLSPGIYAVTAKNDLGCSSPAISATIDPQPITPSEPVITTVSPVCGFNFGTITVSSPVAGYKYSINGTDYTNTTGVFEQIPLGTYPVTAKTAAGCISPDTSVIIKAYTAPYTVDSLLCSTAATITTAKIRATLYQGYTYTLVVNSATVLNNSTGIFDVMPGTYKLSSTNENGCNSTPVTITISPRPAVPTAPITTVTQPSCGIATATITVNTPISGMNYLLKNSGGTIIGNNTTGVFSGLAASATYSVQASISTAVNLGCTSTSVASTVNAQPITATVTAVPSKVFCNATATTAVTFASPTTGGTIVYNWTNNTPSIGLAASGTGNLPVFTTANTTSAPVTATISVTATCTNTNGSCTSTAMTFTITVNPKATVTAVSNQVLCTGTASTAVTFASPSTGGTIVYNWTNNTTSIGLAANGSGNLPIFTAANATTDPVAATITVTPTYSNGGASCVGTPFTFTITVNPKATVTAVANQVMCNGINTTAVNFASPTKGGTIVYNWTNSAPSIGLAASGTGNIAAFAAVNTGTAPVVATITVTPTYTNGGVSCTGTPTTFTITVTPNNSLVLTSAAGTNAQTVCINTAITPIKYSSTGATGATVTGLPAGVTGAFASNVFTINGTPTVAVTTTSPSVFNYTVTYTGGCGIASTTTATGRITVNPKATVTAITNKVVCNAATLADVNFTSPTTGGDMVYNWTNSLQSIGLAANGTGNIASFTAVNTGIAPVIATITVTPTYTNGGVSCTGTASTFTITVNPTATVTALTNKVVCNGALTAAISFASTATGGTVVYNWTNNTPSIGLAASGTGNIAAFTAANATAAPVIATITVTPTYTNGAVSCTGTASTFTIAVNPKATATTVSNQVICTGASSTAVTFGSPTTGGTITYAWTNNTASIGLGASGTGNLHSFTAANTTAAPVTAIITVTPTYANGGVSCTGTASTFTITVNPKAVVTAVANKVICNGGASAAVAFASTTTGGTIAYNWTNNTTSIGLAASGSGNLPAFTATNTTAAPIMATITVTPTFTNGGVTCTGTAMTFTITVNPVATVKDMYNQVLCVGASSTAVTFGSPTTGGTIVYNWTNNTASIGLAASGTGNLAVFTAANTTAAPVVATITVTPIYSNSGVSCTGTASTFTITVNPKAKVTAVSNQVICTGAPSTAVTFGSPTTGGTITYAWTNNTTSIGLGASGTGNLPSFTAANTTAAPVIATITVTPTYTNGGVSCTGTASTFTITVNPKALVTAVANKVICNAGASAAVAFASTATGGTIVYNWTNTAPSIGLAASGNGGLPAFTAVNTTAAPVVATITVTPTYTNGGVSCLGTASTFTITVNPKATVTTVPNQVICTGAPSTAVTFGSPNTGGMITYAWTNNTISIGLAASGTGNLPSFTAANTGIAPVTATITVTPTYANGGVSCTGTASTFTITVNPKATVTAVTNKVVCNDATLSAVTFASPTTGGTVTYNWTNNTTSIGLAASGTGNIAAFTAVNTSTAPVIATITVTPTYTNGGVSCTGTASTFTITVNPKATVAAVANKVVCTTTPITAVTFTSPTTGGTIVYNWTNNTTSIGLAASGTGNLPAFTAANNGISPVTATITVTPTYTNGAVSCTGTPTSFSITVNPLNSITLTSLIGTKSQTVCVNAPIADISYAIMSATGATVTGLPAGVTGTLVNNVFTISGTPTVVGTSTYTVTLNGGCGTALTSTGTIAVNAPPTIASAVTTNAAACAGSTATLAYTATTGTPTSYSIVWNASPANSFVAVTNQTATFAAGAGTISIPVPANTAAGTYTGTITVKNALGCVSVGKTFTITVSNVDISTFATANPVYTNSLSQTTTLNYSSTSGSPISYSIVWSSTPVNALAQVTNQTYTFAAADGFIPISIPANLPIGSYTGTISAKNAGGCVSAGKQFTVSVLDVPTAKGTAPISVPPTPITPVALAPVLPPSDLFEVSAYPNPTTTDFKLNINSASSETSKVTVYDMFGRSVKYFSFGAKKSITIGQDLKAGVYMIEVRQGKNVKTLKVVKF